MPFSSISAIDSNYFYCDQAQKMLSEEKLLECEPTTQARPSHPDPLSQEQILFSRLLSEFRIDEENPRIDQASTIARKHLLTAESNTLYFLCALDKAIKERKITQINIDPLLDTLSEIQLLKIAKHAIFNGYLETSHKFYTRAGLKGNGYALYCLATQYESGTGTKLSPALAFLFCQRAAEKGYVPAIYMRGRYLETGFGTRQDFTAALEAYKRAANENNPEAMLRMAKYYIDELNKPALAQSYILDLIRMEYPPAFYYQGARLYQSQEHDLKGQGIRLIKQAANNGDAEANLFLGCYFCMGREGKEKINCCIPYFHRAASLGKSEAYVALGKIYYEGEITEQNLDLSIRCFSEASSTDDGVVGLAKARFEKEKTREALNPLFEKQETSPEAALEIFKIFKNGKYGIAANWKVAIFAFANVKKHKEFCEGLDNYFALEKEWTMLRNKGSELASLASGLVEKRIAYTELSQTIPGFGKNELNNFKEKVEEQFQSQESNFIDRLRGSSSVLPIESQITPFLELMHSQLEQEKLSIQSSFADLFAERILDTKIAQAFALLEEYELKEEQDPDFDNLKNSEGILFLEEKSRCLGQLVDQLNTLHSQSVEILEQINQEISEEINLKVEQIFSETTSKILKLVESHVRSQAVQKLEAEKKEVLRQLTLRSAEISCEWESYEEKNNLLLKSLDEDLSSLQVNFDAQNFDQDIQEARETVKQLKIKCIQGMNELSIMEKKEELKNEREKYKGRVEQLTARAQQAESKLREFQNKNYKTEWEQRRAESCEIEELQNQLHRERKLREQAEKEFERKQELQKSEFDKKLKEQQAIIDRLKEENNQFKESIRNEKTTTSIPILIDRINERIADLQSKGGAYLNGKKIGQITGKLTGKELLKILRDLSFEHSQPGGGSSHRTLTREEEAINLTVHNLGQEPDPAQTQQALNFLLSALKDAKGE